MNPDPGGDGSGAVPMVATRAGCDHHAIDDERWSRRRPGTPPPPIARLLRRVRTRPESGPLRRRTEARLVGGVAIGIAKRFGIDVTVVRVLIVAMMLGGGSGAVAYVAAWLFVPAENEHTSIGQRALRDRRTLALAIALGGAMVAAMFVLRVLGLTFVAGFLWSIAATAGGLLIVWLHAGDADRDALRQLASQDIPGFDGRSRTLAALRVGVGALLIAGSVFALAATQKHPGEVGKGVSAAVVILAGFALIFGPFWLRLVRDLSHERRERVRSQTRADMADHLHDSVLQTLALIQRRAEDPREVLRLARAQERELRDWLFEASATTRAEQMLSTAINAIESEVEMMHGVTVDTVVVGDAPLDESLAALTAAAREAVMNAAKWSQAPNVSLYAEVHNSTASVFVRDRGRGFDPTSVQSDRRGIAQSIHGRMRRHGGTATIRSAPGEGTEVELKMPVRSAP